MRNYYSELLKAIELFGSDVLILKAKTADIDSGN